MADFSDFSTSFFTTVILSAVEGSRGLSQGHRSGIPRLSSQMEIEKVNVLGVGISVIDQDRAREFLFDAVRQGRRGYVAVTGVHGVSEAQNDPVLRDILNRALLCTPDGMPMVWMGRFQGKPSIQRVYGPDLMLNLVRAFAGRKNSRIFFMVACLAWPTPLPIISNSAFAD